MTTTAVELPVVQELETETFGPELADCAYPCELQKVCAQRYVGAYIGAKYESGGIMFVGEGPGVTEVSRGEPFVGPSGRLLNALLEAAGLEREQCWITNATLGLPPKDKGKAQSFDKRFPNAIYACLPRLEREIAAARPRVIVTLGQAALIALTGYEVTKLKQVRFECEGGCNDKRKVGPALCCAVGDCDWYAMVPVLQDPDYGDPVEPDTEQYASAQKQWRDNLIQKLGGKCPKCDANIKRLRPRMMKCPTCEGRLTRQEPTVTFGHDYGLIGRDGAAGAVFKADELPGRLDKLGVRYVIPTYHPAFCLRAVKDKQKRIGGQYAARAAVAHFEKAKALLKREARFDYSVRTTRDAAVAREWLDARKHKRVACDIETNSEDGPWAVTRITCIGFATADDPEALVVDTRHIPEWWTLDVCPLLDVLQLYLEDEEAPKVWHNGSYDRVVIARLWGIDVRGTVGDTMLAHNACYPDEEHNLAFVAHELTDAPMWKAGRKSIPKGMRNDCSGYANFDDLADYNAKDDRLTALIDEIMVGEHGLLVRDGVPAAYALDLANQEVAIEMELRGLPLSRKRLEAIADEYRVIMDSELEAMRDIAGSDSFIPRGEALLWVLYDPTGPIAAPVPGKTATGKPSTSKDHLLKMAHEPFVQHLLRWRKYSYHLSHYVTSEKLAPAADGRVHPTWKVIGARTGRWSSEPNFQNWPKTMRAVVVAPPGRKIVGADYSQLEMRIMAALSGDPELIRRCAEADESDKLNPERDPHAYVASMAFGKTYVEAYRTGNHERCKALRDIAKRVVYGLNYGAGSATVLAAVYEGGYEGPPLTIKIIDAVKESYFRGFPGVPTWREQQLRLAHHSRSVRSPITGRHRIFPLEQIDSTVVYNYPIQSGAADIMSTQLLVLRAALPHVDPSAFLIAQVHDAVYVECDERRAEDVAQCIEQSLSCDLCLVNGALSMPFVATATISDNWRDA